MEQLRPDETRRLRGAMLMLLRSRHNQQLARMDDVELTHALRALAFECGLNDVVTQLQIMHDDGYVRFRERREILGVRRVKLENVEITARGHNLIEGNIAPDPAIEF